MKKLNYWLIALAILASLAIGVYWAFFRMKTEKFFQKDNFVNAGELEVYNNSGGITIEGFDKLAIETTVYYKTRGNNPNTGFIKINVKDNKANIHVEGIGNGSNRVHIKVPRNINLKKIETSAFGGNITIKNVEGMVNAEAKYGSIILDNVTGQIKTNALGGTHFKFSKK